MLLTCLNLPDWLSPGCLPSPLLKGFFVRSAHCPFSRNRRRTSSIRHLEAATAWEWFHRRDHQHRQLDFQAYRWQQNSKFLLLPVSTLLNLAWLLSNQKSGRLWSFPMHPPLLWPSCCTKSCMWLHFDGMVSCSFGWRGCPMQRLTHFQDQQVALSCSKTSSK